MALHTIKAGRHDDDRLFSSLNLPWVSNNPGITRYVRFDESCRYTLPSYNALDVNKLFGLSFGLFAVHQNSARFGWRYNADQDCIDLLAYCYINGQRNWDDQLNFPVVARLPIGICFECSISYQKAGYFIFNAHLPGISKHKTLVGSAVVGIKAGVCENLPRYGMTHGVWFGGTLPAQHDTRIYLSKAPL